MIEALWNAIHETKEIKRVISLKYF